MWNFNTIKNSLEIGPILAPKSQVHCSNIETPESTLSEPVQFDLTFFPPSRTRVDEVVSLNLPVKRFLYSRLVPHSAPRVSWLKHWQVKFTGLLTNLGQWIKTRGPPFPISLLWGEPRGAPFARTSFLGGSTEIPCLCLSLISWQMKRLSMFELRETGDWDIFLGPPERARAETGGADQWVLKRRECWGFARVNQVTSASLRYPLSVFN